MHRGHCLYVGRRHFVVCALQLAILMATAAITSGQPHVNAITSRLASAKRNWPDTWTDKLRRDLLTSYDRLVKPTTDCIDVHLGMSLKYFELDEVRATFTASVWLTMTWYDPKLRWASSEYGNVTRIHVDDHEIWVPDIHLYNSAKGQQIDYFGNTQAHVTPNGSVMWVPPSQLTAYCAMDMRSWPYDEHQCELKMGSWTYSGDELALHAHRMENRDLVENYEWRLVLAQLELSEIRYACCPEPYADMTFTFRVARRSEVYRAVVATPAAVVVLLTLAALWLPAGETVGETRLLLMGVNVVVIVGFLLYFARRLPSMGAHTPYVVLFFSNALYLTGISIVLSVLVLNIARHRHVRPVPWWLRSALDGWPGRILLLHWLGYESTASATGQSDVHLMAHSGQTQEMREQIGVSAGGGGGGTGGILGADAPMFLPENQRINFGSKFGPQQHYWIMLATAIDRLMFVVFAIVFAIMAIKSIY